MPSLEILAALAQVDVAQANLRRLIEAEAAESERPVPLKTAADRFGVHDKWMQRFARNGGGVKIRGRWYVFESRIVMPLKCPQVSANRVR